MGIVVLLFGLAAVGVTGLPQNPGAIQNVEVSDDSYDPDIQNTYHLFTRSNPSVSQPLVVNYNDSLRSSNYDPNKRTIVLVHGWHGSGSDHFNALLVHAFLSGGDVNIITVDWNAGARNKNYMIAMRNVVTSGAAVARFIAWLNRTSGSILSMFHLVGLSLGGQQVGIIGRNLGGAVGYITGLDPAGPGWEDNVDTFKSTDGVYTEVIHTNAGQLGLKTPIGDVDFFPNGGTHMPGCNNNGCSHVRSAHYMAESVISGGFTGKKCENYEAATSGNCNLAETLQLGGPQPKTGASGLYYLETNDVSPYSKG